MTSPTGSDPVGAPGVREMSPDRSTDNRPQRIVTPLLGAAAFLLFYLAVSPVVSRLQGGPMPLPGAPQDQVYAYLTTSTGASIATGVLQGLSALGLALVIASPILQITRTGDRVAPGRRALLATIGAVAVIAMLVTVGLSIALGVMAPTATPQTLFTMRNVAFIAGGVVHVVALGLFVGLLSQLPGWPRPVTIFGAVAAILAVLSIASTVWFYASILLPVGRLLCMLWLVVAASLLVQRRHGLPMHRHHTRDEGGNR
jgi:hypothetical protein